MNKKVISFIKILFIFVISFCMFNKSVYADTNITCELPIYIYGVQDGTAYAPKNTKDTGKLSINGNTMYVSLPDKYEKNPDGAVYTSLGPSDFANGCPEKIYIMCNTENKNCTVYRLSDVKEIISSISESFDKIEYDVGKVSELDIGVGESTLECEDVQMLHTIWIIMWIIAPVLVIVLGTVDFFKAVIAGDQEKMNKSRKKFPKRIVAVFVLILSPAVVGLIVNLISINNLSDTSIMYCIINGKSDEQHWWNAWIQARKRELEINRKNKTNDSDDSSKTDTNQNTEKSESNDTTTQQTEKRM